MINICCMYEMFDILTDFNKKSISRSFVGDETEVLELLGVCNECSEICPDIIQFNSEEEDYFVFSLDNIDGNIYYSILPAINEKTGKFYGCNGDLFVSTTVPTEFERDVKSYEYIDVDSITRVSFEEETEKNSAEDDNCGIYTEKSDHGITQSWCDGNSYYSRSYYSSDAKNLESIAKEWNDFAQRLQNRG